jgi:hypothetical protein
MSEVVSNIIGFFCPSPLAKMKRAELTNAIRQLRAEVRACRCCKPNLVVMEKLIKIITHLHPRWRNLAAEILADSDNLECKDLAVQTVPALGKRCGDSIMPAIRIYLEFSDDLDFAIEARTSLTYACSWYRQANCFEDKIFDEVTAGLLATEWLNRRKA